MWGILLARRSGKFGDLSSMHEPVRGIVHVHSDFSRDGLCSIAELAAFARASGLRFVGLTDHAEDLSSDDMKQLRQLCEEHSDESLLMLPGLEFRCSGDIHILGLGITDAIASVDPITVASQVQRLGGIGILAHPDRNGYHVSKDLCGVLNGIEIWNVGSDGRFVPPVRALHLLRESRDRNPAIAAFGGVDLHGLDGLPAVNLELQLKGSSRLDAQTLLDLLLSGRFAIRGRYVVLEASLPPNRLTCFSLWAFRKIYEVSKTIRDAIPLGEV